MFDQPLLLDRGYFESAWQRCADNQELFNFLFPQQVNDPISEPENGVAVIRVYGTLSHRGWRSYESIAHSFTKALESDHVKGIALIFDSPGGAANGCFDVCDLIYNSRNIKPSLAIVDEQAGSGAFALASSCSKIVLPRTASVGSVGVVRMHWDMSGALEQWGEKVTFIYEGAHKIDGSMYRPLQKSAKDRFQEGARKTYELFCETVSRNLGMSLEDVMGTEALTYVGDDAVSIGFANEVTPAREALANFISELNPKQGVSIMKIKTSDLVEKLQAEGLDEEAISRLGLPTADEIDLDEPKAAGDETPESESVSEEEPSKPDDQRQRISEILGCEEATGREELANKIALTTDIPAEEAKGLLGASPKSQGPMSQFMDGSGGAGVDGSDGGEGDGADEVSVQDLWNDSIDRAQPKLPGK